MAPLTAFYIFAITVLTVLLSMASAQQLSSPAIGTIVRPFACNLGADTTGMDDQAFADAANDACNEIVNLNIGPYNTNWYDKFTTLSNGHRIETTLSWVDRQSTITNTDCDEVYSGGVKFDMSVCQAIMWTIIHDDQSGCGMLGGRTKDQCINYSIRPNPQGD